MNSTTGGQPSRRRSAARPRHERRVTPFPSALSAALRETHRRRDTASGPTVDIGLAWRIVRRPAGPILTHNGGTGGFHSYLGFDPARRVGVVVLANSSVDLDDIGRHLLDPTLPLTPVVKHTEVVIDPRRLDDYLGRYQLAPAFAITVTREGNQLFVQATSQPRFPAYPEAEGGRGPGLIRTRQYGSAVSSAARSSEAATMRPNRAISSPQRTFRSWTHSR